MEKGEYPTPLKERITVAKRKTTLTYKNPYSPGWEGGNEC